MLSSKIREFVHLPLVKNTLKLSSSSALMMFLPLIVTPILSRLYTPDDYGNWGVFSSTLYILNSFIFLSYENAIVKTTDRREVPNILALCIFICSIILIGTLFTFVVGKWLGIAFFIDFPSIILLLVLIGVTALYTLYGNVANFEKQYNAMAIAGIICGLSQAGLRIFLGAVPIVPNGLIVGNVLGLFIALIYLLFAMRQTVFSQDFLQFSSNEIKKVAVRYKKFPLFDAPSRFFEFAVGNLALLILAIFWPKGEIGCFSMVTQFILIPIAIIGSAMGNVFYKEISENAENAEVVSRSTIRAVKITFALSCLPLLFLTCGGDYLFTLFLGDKWTNVGPMALCMCIYSVPVILTEPLLAIFKTLDKQEIRFRFNILNFVISLGLLFIVSNTFDNIYLSLIVYSSSYAIIRFIIFHYELRLTNVKISSISKFFYPIIIGSYVLLFLRISLSVF